MRAEAATVKSCRLRLCVLRGLELCSYSLEGVDQDGRGLGVGEILF